LKKLYVAIRETRLIVYFLQDIFAEFIARTFLLYTNTLYIRIALNH